MAPKGQQRNYLAVSAGLGTFALLAHVIEMPGICWWFSAATALALGYWLRGLREPKEEKKRGFPEAIHPTEGHAVGHNRFCSAHELAVLAEQVGHYVLHPVAVQSRLLEFLKVGL